MMQRKYGISDAILLETADTIIGYLENDINQFTTFDPAEFPTTFINTVKQKVTDAFIEGGDTFSKTQLKVQTGMVNKEMDNCKTYMEDLKYWVKKSFIDHPAIQQQFGVNRFGEIFGSQPRLIQFMESLSHTIHTHRAELVATGTPVTLLDQAEPLSTALRDANTTQENLKGNRTITTESRIIHLNSLYDLLRKIEDAAGLIYRNEEAKKNLYRISVNQNSSV
ncbi:hypothetical protein [Aquimarina muelleri]|uniref:Uncharacterized protein n=1 Tax=Aquimarina muelleri TaxID=279356 RepID=A0A918JTM7_9FLAO|nr:hypothetical protein [Aquimarina muelleri]MCX2761306.1 hypothetical protein [Aquimarina muelleri]GGX12418.1 hypothetical protein GCM10007384_12770 [Aquimarina muelleri]